VSSEKSTLLERYGWIAGMTAIFLALIWILKPIIALLAVSAAIAYVLDPIVDWFQRRRLSREVAIGILFITFIVFSLLIIVLMVPAFIVQSDSLSTDFLNLLDEIESTLVPINEWLAVEFGMVVDLQMLNLRESIPGWLEGSGGSLTDNVKWVAQGLFTQGLGLISTLINLALLPIFVFYLLKDWDDIKSRCLTLVPVKYRERTLSVMTEVDTRLSAFVRGQITVCLSLSLLYTIGLWLVECPLAAPIGLLSGLLFFIPYVGTAFGMLCGCLLALVAHGLSWEPLAVIGVFAVAQMIEGWILTPYIVGDKVGLSPLVVMICLIVGGSLMGIWGMALAIPLTAVLVVLGREWIAAYQQSTFFNSR